METGNERPIRQRKTRQEEEWGLEAKRVLRRKRRNCRGSADAQPKQRLSGAKGWTFGAKSIFG
eukprot:5072852-Pleurochrysis_carterae.AAC.1